MSLYRVQAKKGVVGGRRPAGETKSSIARCHIVDHAACKTCCSGLEIGQISSCIGGGDTRRLGVDTHRLTDIAGVSDWFSLLSEEIDTLDLACFLNKSPTDKHLQGEAGCCFCLSVRLTRASWGSIKWELTRLCNLKRYWAGPDAPNQCPKVKHKRDRG